MTNFLLRLFVKNYNDNNSADVRSTVGRLAGLTGTVCNILLTISKLIVGIIADSTAIIADGINNLTDATSSVVTLLGFKLAQRPADKEHPYGHARIEYLAGLIISGMILLVGFELIKTSLGKILIPHSPVIVGSTIIVLVISIVAKLWMSHFFKRLGKQIQSAALIATAVDSRNDVLATAATLLGCLANFFFHVNWDGYIGLAVALFIFYSGIRVAKDTISPLLGQQADIAFIEKISQIILFREKVLGIHDLLIHDYGPGQCYASVHVEISANEEPIACHMLIDEIEQEVLHKMNVHLVIHYDPVAEENI